MVNNETTATSNDNGKATKKARHPQQKGGCSNTSDASLTALISHRSRSAAAAASAVASAAASLDCARFRFSAPPPPADDLVFPRDADRESPAVPGRLLFMPLVATPPAVLCHVVFETRAHKAAFL